MGWSQEKVPCGPSPTNRKEEGTTGWIVGGWNAATSQPCEVEAKYGVEQEEKRGGGDERDKCLYLP